MSTEVVDELQERLSSPPLEGRCRAGSGWHLVIANGMSAVPFCHFGLQGTLVSQHKLKRLLH